MINEFYKVNAPILVIFNTFFSYPITIFMPDSYTLESLHYSDTLISLIIFIIFTTLFLLINALVILKRKKEERDFSIVLYIIFIILLPLTIPVFMYNIAYTTYNIFCYV